MKMIKIMFIGFGAALAAAACIGGITALCRRSGKKNSDDIDGGVVKQYQADVPKVIASTEIVEFHAEISLLASCDTDEPGYLLHKRVYKLDAVLADDGVLVRYDWYDRQGSSDRTEYKTDAGFMARLQEIAAAHNFARYNGYFHKVSGLPDMYGEILDIVYASGEQICVYDNQCGFLPYEAERDLIMLFDASEK